MPARLSCTKRGFGSFFFAILCSSDPYGLKAIISLPLRVVVLPQELQL